jgi:hypothetical protein
LDTRGDYMKCYVCDTDLIWGGDHNGDELGHDDENVIVSNLSCPNCGAFHEVTWNHGEQYELDS